MHIVIAGGYEQTDFLIENLKENGHKLTVIFQKLVCNWKRT